MLQGIPDSGKVVVERTGHMLRYSHPVTYSKTVRAFLVEQVGDGLTGVCVMRVAGYEIQALTELSPKIPVSPYMSADTIMILYG